MLKVVHSSRRLLVILVALVSAPILMSLVNNSASAANLTPSVTVNSSITVTIPSTPINLNLNPYSNNFGYGDVTITVGTNNPAGYKTIMTSADGTTNLTDSEDAEKVIPTLTTSGLTESTFEVNHWGYKKDSGNYQPFTTDTVVLESDTYANDDTTTLRFATKIDYMQPEGDYSTVLSFTTTATPNLPTIQNLDPTLCTATPTTVLDSRDGQEYTVARLADGNCWMTENLNLAGGTALSAADTDVSSEYINGFATGNGLTKNANSTISLPSSSASGFDDDSKAFVYNTTNKVCSSGSSCYGYYSWIAATLGGRRADGSTAEDRMGYNTAASICPKGWKLPTATTSNANPQTSSNWKTGDFYKLATAYGADLNSNFLNTNDTAFYNNAGPGTLANFLLAGKYYSGSFGDGGSYGRYWSSTAYNFTEYAYTSAFSSPKGYWTAAGNAARSGYSVRCILNDTRTLSDITYLQDMTSGIVSRTSTGTTKTLKDKRDNEEYLVGKLADGNIWLLDNLRLDPTAVSLDNLKGNTNATDEILTYFKNGGGSSPYPASGVVTKTATGGSWNNSHELPYVATSGTENGGWTKDTVASVKYGSGSGKIGVYYNYCAASAGSYCYASGSGSGNAQYDICPSGWKMPTGNTAAGSYYYLYNTSYSANVSNFKAALSIPLSGYYSSGGSASLQGTYGYFWSSTRYSGTDIYTLEVNSSSINPRVQNHRPDGFPVRCIAK